MYFYTKQNSVYQSIYFKCIYLLSGRTMAEATKKGKSSVIGTAGQNKGSSFLMTLESSFNVQSFAAFACQSNIMDAFENFG